MKNTKSKVMKNPKPIEGLLLDQYSSSLIMKPHNPPLPCKVEFLPNGSIGISPKGYGDCDSQDGCGVPILIEVVDGKLQVTVWGNINKSDPTHTISLEKARESSRKNDWKRQESLAEKMDNLSTIC